VPARLFGMRRAGPPPRRGFVLLHTLVLLLALASLFLGVQTLGVRQARTVAAEARLQVIEGRLESAAHELSFRLLERSSYAPGRVESMMQGIAIEGVEASVTPADTLLDLNHAEAEDVLRVMQAAGVTRAGAATQALLRSRPIQTFAALQDLGVDGSAMRCLLRSTTLSSGLRRPVEGQAGPAAADRAMPGASRAAGESAVVGAPTLAGRAFRYWIRLAAGTGEGGELVVEVRLTGRIEQPIQVLEWFRLPREPAPRC
jgi:hypothetical protein